MKSQILSCLLSLILLFVFPAIVDAHSSIYSIKAFDKQNVILVSYNVHEVQARVPVKYNIRLYEVIDGKPVPFDYVRVQFKRGRTTDTSRDIKMSNNIDATTAYPFPKEGLNQMDVSFFKDNKQLAQASFPILVEKGLYKDPLANIVSPYVLLAFLMGVIVTRVFWKKK